jgi:hypothetical protein
MILNPTSSIVRMVGDKADVCRCPLALKAPCSCEKKAAPCNVTSTVGAPSVVDKQSPVAGSGQARAIQPSTVSAEHTSTPIKLDYKLSRFKGLTVGNYVRSTRSCGGHETSGPQNQPAFGKIRL